MIKVPPVPQPLVGGDHEPDLEPPVPGVDIDYPIMTDLGVSFTTTYNLAKQQLEVALKIPETVLTLEVPESALQDSENPALPGITAQIAQNLLAPLQKEIHTALLAVMK